MCSYPEHGSLVDNLAIKTRLPMNQKTTDRDRAPTRRIGVGPVRTYLSGRLAAVSETCLKSESAIAGRSANLCGDKILFILTRLTSLDENPHGKNHALFHLPPRPPEAEYARRLAD